MGRRRTWVRPVAAEAASLPGNTTLLFFFFSWWCVIPLTWTHRPGNSLGNGRTSRATAVSAWEWPWRSTASSRRRITTTAPDWEDPDDYYAILAVTRSTRTADIKATYRQWALEYHPDKLPVTATDSEKEMAQSRFVLLTTAYEVLSDPHLRRVYNHYGLPGLELVRKGLDPWGTGTPASSLTGGQPGWWLSWWHRLPPTLRVWGWRLITSLLLVLLWPSFLTWYQSPTRPAAPTTSKTTTTTTTTSTTHQSAWAPKQLQTEGLPEDLQLVVEEEPRVETAPPVDQKNPDPSSAQPDGPLGQTQVDDVADHTAFHGASAENPPEQHHEPPSKEAAAATERRRPTRATTIRTLVPTSTILTPSPFHNQSSNHPGLEAFWYWCDIECSLFRMYTLERTDGLEVHPPYNPTSRRGQVPVALRVGNQLTQDQMIDVYWVNYKGQEEYKGKILPGQTWFQTTWIDHPWVFREHLGGGGGGGAPPRSGRVLLHYIPYRVIPTTPEAPTVDDYDDQVGRHAFDIRSGVAPWACSVQDDVLPFPAQSALTTPLKAVTWTLLHGYRMKYSGWEVLKKYLSKIVQHPEEPKYRQIRVANRNFGPQVWNTPARGLLLAAGFVEHGAVVELGTDTHPLPRDRVQELSQLLWAVEQWQQRAASDDAVRQPPGADGYGRAGFGRAGSID